MTMRLAQNTRTKKKKIQSNNNEQYRCSSAKSLFTQNKKFIFQNKPMLIRELLKLTTMT